MKNKKLVLAFMIFSLLAILLLLGEYIFAPSWFDSPVKIIFTIIAALVGVMSFLANASQYFGWFSDKNSSVPSTVNKQINLGDNDRNIINYGTYNENNLTNNPAEKAAPLTPGIPAKRTEKYLARGIEEKIENVLCGKDQRFALIYGQAGMGKSEMAKKICEEISQNFEGVYWIDFGEKTYSQILSDLLFTFAIKSPGSESEQLLQLQDFLSHHHYLFVYDDLHQVQCPHLGELLLHKSCSFLLTSRIIQTGANIPRNRTFELVKMSPELSLELVTNILGEEIVARETEEIQQVIERCQNNPLAMEIAARCISLNHAFSGPVGAYLQRLSISLRSLNVTNDPRLNLFAVFDQTYEHLLSPEEKIKFSQLSVFNSNHFNAKAAAAIWAISEEEAETTILQLQNVYLLRNANSRFLRYQLHDLLSEFASEKLPLEEKDEIHQRLFAWLMVLFAEHALDDIVNAPELAEELNNLRTLVDWAKTKKDGDTLTKLSTIPRNWFYVYFRNYVEWDEWLTLSMKFGIHDPKNKANTLRALGDLLQFKKASNQALSSFQQALVIYRAIDDRLGEANTLRAMGDLLQFKKASDQALSSYQQALDLFRAVGDRLGKANTLQAMGDLFQFKKETDQALSSYQQALEIYRAVGARLGEANTLKAMGDLLMFKNQTDQALSSYQQALDLFRAIGDRLGEANTLQAMGDLLQFKDQRDQALSSYQQALDIYRAVGARLGEANTLGSLGRQLVQIGKQKDGVQMVCQAAQIHETIGDFYGSGADFGNLAVAFWELQDYSQALLFAEKAKTIFEKNKLFDQINWADNLISEIVSARDNEDKKS